MIYRLVNSTIMPAPGTYHLVRIGARSLGAEVARAASIGLLVSYIGYEQTARLIERLAGVPIPVSREPAVVEDGDILLICKLRYRVANPATKGQDVDERDFEFFRCVYRAEVEDVR